MIAGVSHDSQSKEAIVLSEYGQHSCFRESLDDERREARDRHSFDPTGDTSCMFHNISRVAVLLISIKQIVQSQYSSEGMRLEKA